MELTLLNYEDKKTVISYDMQNNEYWKIFYNTEGKGFYDIWENDIFGVIVLNQATWMFVETNIFRLTDISKIENNITFLIISSSNSALPALQPSHSSHLSHQSHSSHNRPCGSHYHLC